MKGSGLHYISTLELAELIASWCIALSTRVCVGIFSVCCVICMCVCYSVTEKRTQSYCENNLNKIIKLVVQQNDERKENERVSKGSLMTPGNGSSESV